MMRYGKATMLVVLCGGMAWTAGPASAAVRTWDGSTDNNWNWLFNWSGNDVPDTDDTAVIGAAPNNAVQLNANSALIDGLTINGGASVNTNGFILHVDNIPDTAPTIIGNGSTLIVAVVAANANSNGFDTDRLTVQSGGTFGSVGRSIIDDVMTVNTGGNVASTGTITIGNGATSGVGLNNNGTITSGFLGAGNLTINAAANQTLDLDGSIGNGIVRATGDAFLGGIAAANLTINGPLSDAFGGTMEIARRDSITFSNAWTKNAGVLTFRGADGGDAADLNGGTLTHTGGTIEVTQGTAVFNARLTMNGGTLTPSANTTVNFNNTTNINAAADLDLAANNITVNINGSTVISQTASLDLDGTGGNNTINVGTNDSLRIESTIADAFDGTLNMADNSTLTLNSNITFSSGSTLGMNVSAATLNIGATTTINTAVDLDGPGGVAFNTINLTNSAARLTLNADTDSSANDAFDGTILNRGTLTFNNQPGGDWENNGTVRLIDVGPDPSVNGDDLQNNGTITGNGRFNNRVFHRGNGVIQPGTASTAGRLNFADLLRVDQGEIEFDLGGLTPGTQHDRIDAGSVTLYTGSRIDLDLIGGYVPGMYVEHVLIDATALGFNDVFNFVDGVVIPATGTGLAVTYNYATDQVLVQRALLGDANLNGQVEQADLDAVLLNWGQQGTTHGTSWVTGDLNGNGQVEQGDLDFVLLNWGDTAEPDLRGALVPEPTTALLLGAAGVVLFARRGRHAG